MISEYKIKTMDDFDFKGKVVLVRIDVNSPINQKTNEIMDDRRFLSHKKTIQELIEKKAKVVIIAHQGRPGDPDFTTLEKHAELLSKVIEHKIRYIDCVFSSYVINEIKKMKSGDIIMLENSRFCAEENIIRPADVQAKTHMVRKLSSVIDIYVDDAFGTAHRSQPSLVGFPEVLPCCAGRLMEREIKIIDKIMKTPKKPVTFILGGTKADDSFKAAEKALSNGTDYILAGGLVGNIFLVAKGYRIGEPSIEFIRGKGLIEQIDVAKALLDKYDDKIITPVDLALDYKDERFEIDVSELPRNYVIKDIGRKTIEKFKEIIRKSGTVFAKGALGVFEDEKFAIGTEEIVKEIADNRNAFSVVGGGHLVASVRKLNVEDKITHISSGGGACISMLAGYSLPAVEALRGK
ncbi:MAG: phosphoglycerate kinase [Candidatus Altiarchaeota archaeon]